ncbi:MAG: glycosyltransferase family 2 protein [bacterium]|nr:glycosyltransferase family 2 protein [bacterium]
MRDLAVVIVSWNVRDLVLNAIRSLVDDLHHSALEAAIWLVDNASGDGTVEAVRAQFPQVRVIASAENLGFVRGNNAALRAMGFDGVAAPDELPRAVYLLNPDTITRPGATRILFDRLMRFSERSNERIGLVGARLSYEDGSFQHGAFRFPGLRQLWVEFFPTPGRWIEGGFNGRYPAPLTQGSAAFPVDFVLGATMMLRREVIQQVGLLDETFFMYCEEIDWAWRIHKAGWRVECVPAAQIVHLAGKSTGQARPQTTLHLWTSRLRLFEKHYPRWKQWAARSMIRVGMARKIRRLSDAPPALIEAYQQVIRLARD